MNARLGIFAFSGHFFKLFNVTRTILREAMIKRCFNYKQIL